MSKFTKKLFSLGDLYVSDFINVDTDARAGKHDMTLVIDERYGAARLEKCTPIHSMFGKYWYRSGINQTMRTELKGIVDSVTSVQKLNEGDLWLDIACNDGTLLSFVPDGIKKLGIDPAEDSFVAESSKIADDIVQDYFTLENFKKSKFKKKKAKVVTCIAMFYDLDEPVDFLKDVSKVMDDDGLFVIQMSYTPLMIKQLAFDNICHEHVYYWGLASMEKLLKKAGLKIVDCQVNDVNGGSFRIYIKKKKSAVTSFATAPYRDVCNVRVESLLKWEKGLKLDKEAIWLDFFNRIEELKKETVDFIKAEKAKGKVICGYGASTKGNTLLQYFGLDNTLIDAIAERSPYKFGLKTIGTNIPILSEEDVRAMNPDYMLVLPWHFIAEFVKREDEFLSKGGKFIVPCPTFEIIGKQ
jgi:2-polyprenyl-3-methyl-5-hydroxy-6-metoxy-1,4-benzoquinol methylase